MWPQSSPRGETGGSEWFSPGTNSKHAQTQKTEKEATFPNSYQKASTACISKAAKKMTLVALDNTHTKSHNILVNQIQPTIKQSCMTEQVSRRNPKVGLTFNNIDQWDSPYQENKEDRHMINLSSCGFHTTQTTSQASRNGREYSMCVINHIYEKTSVDSILRNFTRCLATRKGYLLSLLVFYIYDVVANIEEIVRHTD